MRVSIKKKDGDQFFMELPVLPRVGDEIFLHTDAGNHSLKVTDVIFYAYKIETSTYGDVYMYDNLIALFVEQKQVILWQIN